MLILRTRAIRLSLALTYLRLMPLIAKRIRLLDLALITVLEKRAITETMIILDLLASRFRVVFRSSMSLDSKAHLFLFGRSFIMLFLSSIGLESSLCYACLEQQVPNTVTTMYKSKILIFLDIPRAHRNPFHQQRCLPFFFCYFYPRFSGSIGERANRMKDKLLALVDYTL
jgi:hypothetical protein